MPHSKRGGLLVNYWEEARVFSIQKIGRVLSFPLVLPSVDHTSEDRFKSTT